MQLAVGITINRNFLKKLVISENVRMIEKIAGKMATKQVKNGVIDESQKAVYHYGYTVLMEMSINIVLTLLVGFCSGKLLLVILFSLMFIPLRSYCGGWHASRDWMCMLFSLGTLLTVVLVEQFPLMLWIILFEVISLVVILLLAPMDSNTKRLNEKEKRAFRNIARLILILETLILVFAIYFNYKILTVSIILAHIFQSISLMLPKVKSDKE